MNGIANETGKSVFEQKDVEVPDFWSQLATNVVVSKYFRGAVDGPDREHSVRQLVERVSRTITNWGERDGYFAGSDEHRLAATGQIRKRRERACSARSGRENDCGLGSSRPSTRAMGGS